MIALLRDSRTASLRLTLYGESAGGDVLNRTAVPFVDAAFNPR
jgi:hypothetical protein